ncbi:Exostosin-like protein [Corchorus capsularis]|uniref:Exostosin-like protein n=1 Tax=Corchorus capsularis TaxID=210143 RepID=A0A1R3IJ83_COCAP|nr:Exostosin-like protein [Corchorus capsularis]
MVRNPLTVNASDVNTRDLVSNGVLKDGNSASFGGDFGNDGGIIKDSGESENSFASEGMDLDGTVRVAKDRNVDDDYVAENAEDLNEIAALEDVIRNQDNSSLEEIVEPGKVVSGDKLLGNDTIQKAEDIGQAKTTSQTSTLASPVVSSSEKESTGEVRDGFTLEQVVEHGQEVSTGKIVENKTRQSTKELGHEHSASQSPTLVLPVVSSLMNKTDLRNTTKNATMESDRVTSKHNSVMIAKPGKKKMKSEMPPKSVTTIDEMNRIFVHQRRSSRAMRPRRPSPRDQEIFAARSQIENAPAIVNDQELYAPLFRNVSMFKKSYELMERTLKVYVYKEGKKPIFHLPILKGLYASEGWFMRLMQGSKRFVVKDPQRAHLFYMPFSSRMLEYTLYVRNSHNRTNLREFLKDYTESIAAKYPYFNRTGGADHFLVACHDWAPYETRHHMERCIKALCNADVTVGFKIGRDVSLPETYVRSQRNPLRDLGGKRPSQRHILAFYAGSMHGYLRPILLEYWKDKDPDMKIFGPMPPGVASKMNYIQHMKSSKFCICPKGYEVNSPRVVEAIFYECVPVIISDNFVPPLFEVLDWSAFSIILAEKDIPNLKDILLSIPKERYLALQLGVRKAQRHFLWHAKPEKGESLFFITIGIHFGRFRD